MQGRKYEYQSDFARKYFGEGLAKGMAEGEAKGEAKALLLVLAARGIQVSDEARQRVMECDDTAQLDRWIERAASAGSLEEILGDS